MSNRIPTPRQAAATESLSVTALPTASEIMAAADTLHAAIHEHHLETGAPAAPAGMMLAAVVACASAPGESTADRRARAAAHIASGWADLEGIQAADSAAALLASGARARGGRVDSMLESLTAMVRERATAREDAPALGALHRARAALYSAGPARR